MAIKNNIKPEHLGDSFGKVYETIFEKRKLYDKKDPRNYIFKIVLNTTFGLSNEMNGYLYDPKYTYATTINGQLSLLMLVEALYLAIPNIKFIQMNTDGITFRYKKEFKNVVNRIRKWWEIVTKLQLEEAVYEKMIISDVNNYIAIKDGYTIKYNNASDEDKKKLDKDYIKQKGKYAIEIPFHKNPSRLVVSKALSKYFINNISPETFIKSDEVNIFDFCIGVKGKSNFKINLVQNYGLSELVTEQQKVCRFIVSTKNDMSGLLYKDFKDLRKANRTAIVKGKEVTPLDYINPERHNVDLYPIDFQYYISETEKIINEIEPKVIQTELF